MSIYLGPNGYLLIGRTPPSLTATGYLAVAAECCCTPADCCNSIPDTIYLHAIWCGTSATMTLTKDPNGTCVGFDTWTGSGGFYSGSAKWRFACSGGTGGGPVQWSMTFDGCTGSGSVDGCPTTWSSYDEDSSDCSPFTTTHRNTGAPPGACGSCIEGMEFWMDEYP